jgi:hypothetical protein
MGTRTWTAVDIAGNVGHEFTIPNIMSACVVDCGEQGASMDLSVGEFKLSQFYDDIPTAKQKALDNATGILSLALNQLEAAKVPANSIPN